MKNIIFLSLLLALIGGISSCTEKEDPIQTVKDRLVGTWVEKSPCYYKCDTVTFTTENKVNMPFNYSRSSLNPIYDYSFITTDSMYFFSSNGDRIWTGLRFNTNNEVQFNWLQQRPLTQESLKPITLIRQ